MTDMANGASLPTSSFGEGSSAVAGGQATSAPAQAPVSDERLFKQAEVNDIVKREKHSAVESFKRMAVEQPSYLQQKHPDFQWPQQQQQGQPQQVQQPQNANFTHDDIRKLAAEEAARLRNEWVQDAYRSAQENEAKQIATDFFNKIQAGKGKHEDFDSAMENIELPQFPNAVQLSSKFENCADIWYHLANDPIKLEAINSLAGKSPKAAYAQMQKLSTTLKDNDAAQNTKLPKAPLSQMRPTTNGMETGEWSVRAARNKYRV